MTRARDSLLTEGTISFFGAIYQKIAGYVFLFVATSLVAPDIFGSFVFALSVVTIIYGIGNSNTHKAISYYIPKLNTEQRSSEIPHVFGKIILIVSIFSAFLFILIVISSHILPEYTNQPEIQKLLLYLSPVVILYSFRDLMLETIRGFEKVRYCVLATSIIFPTARVVLLVLLFGLVSPYLVLITSVVLAWTCAVIILLIFAINIVREQTSSFQESSNVSYHDIALYSIPLFGTGAVSTGVTYLDPILLGVLGSAASPGFYRIAWSVASLSKIVSRIFKSISKPLYVSASSVNENTELTDFYITSARWNTLITVPAVTFLVLESELLVRILFSPDYAQSAAAVPILVVGMAFPKLFGNESQLLEAVGRTRILLFRSIVILLLNLLVSSILILEYGVVGAAAGTAIGLIVGSLFTLRSVIAEIDQVPLTRDHGRFILSGMIAYIVGGAIQTLLTGILEITALFFVILLVYFTSTVFLGGYQAEDLEALRSLSTSVEKKTGFSFNLIIRFVELGNRRNNKTN